MARDRKRPPAEAALPPAPAPAEAPPAEAPAPAPEPRCSACRHFASVEDRFGLCRRFPPAAPTGVFTPRGQVMAHPVVHATNVCGEFAPATPAT